MHGQIAQVDLSAVRARKARLAAKFGETGYQILTNGFAAFALVAVALALAEPPKLAYLAGSSALICLALTVWYNRDLKPLPATGENLNDRLSGDVLGRLNPKTPLTPM